MPLALLLKTHQAPSMGLPRLHFHPATERNAELGEEGRVVDGTAYGTRR